MWQQPLRGLGADLWGFDDYSTRVFPVRERYTADDMHDATYTCAVEALDNGTTTVLDFCHNILTEDHAEATLRAHASTGQRVLFAYGMLGHTGRLETEFADRLAHVRRIHRELGSDDTSLVRLGLGLTTLGYADIARVRTELEQGRDLGLSMTIHQNGADEILALHKADLLGPDLLPVHSNNATDHELGLLASRGCCVSFTTEGEFNGGHSMSVVGRADRAGVRPTLGVDGPSFVAVDMLSQLRITFNIMRAAEAQVEREAGRWPLARRPGTPYITPRRVLEYATVNGAHAVGLADHIGSITPGKQADLVLLGTGPFGVGVGDPAAHVVLQSTVGDVDTVLVAGRVRKRAGVLVDVDLDRLPAMFGEVRRRLLANS
jgi:5-methylthioadenosine/S-adenosylhomocysteine deaminase